jgi:mannosyltransferase OCH1-like enzyme
MVLIILVIILIFVIILGLIIYLIFKNKEENKMDNVHINKDKKIIKKIYMLWYDGFDKAPELVKKCVKSWEYHNPDWEIILLDKNNLRNYFDYKDYNIDFSDKNYNIAHISDVIRTILLKKYGGVWTDATTFCNKPLNLWLPNHIDQDFFAFEYIEKDSLISNWFLYSTPNSYMINKILEDVVKYVNENKVIEDYFIYHHTFYRRYKKDNIFKNHWDKIPKISAHPPHFIQKEGLYSKLSNQVKDHIDNKKANVYKLTWKVKCDDRKDSNFQYLVSTILS